MSGKLLVASVFVRSDRNPAWLALQRRFLARTTADYDHAVFLNREDPALFRDCILIGRDAGGAAGSDEHANALGHVLRYCRAYRSRIILTLLILRSSPLCPIGLGSATLS